MSVDVSVVMSVYNGGPFLGQAIESILGQSHSDFEFIVIDDGSSDDSADTIASYRDARLRVVRHTENAGLATRLNEGFALASGRYIARMDADDVSLPNRLARQIKFMKAHAYVGACGTWVDVAGDGVNQRWEYPASHKAIHARLLFDCAMAHPTVMFDRIRLQKRDCPMILPIPVRKIMTCGAGRWRTCRWPTCPRCCWSGDCTPGRSADGMRTASSGGPQRSEGGSWSGSVSDRRRSRRRFTRPSAHGPGRGRNRSWKTPKPGCACFGSPTGPMSLILNRNSQPSSGNGGWPFADRWRLSWDGGSGILR